MVIRRNTYAIIFLAMCLHIPAMGQEDSAPVGEQVETPAVQTPPDTEAPSYNEAVALNAGGLNPEVQLYNLAVIDAQRGRFALALGRLRQSLYLNPTFQEARRALDWVLDESGAPTQDSATAFEKLRSWLWLYQPAWVYPVGTLLTLFVGLWLLLGWLERLRQNRAQDLDAPPIPFSMPALLVIGVLLATVWGLRSWDRNFVDRATYLGQGGFRASPSPDAPEVAPLRAGEEIVMERLHKGWALAHKPGGAAGWLPVENLYQTTSEPSAEDLAKH